MLTDTKFAGRWATGVFEEVILPNRRPKARPQGPLSFSSGGDLGGAFAGAFVYFYVEKKHLHFYSQNLEKTKVWGSQNGSPN